MQNVNRVPVGVFHVSPIFFGGSVPSGTQASDSSVSINMSHYNFMAYKDLNLWYSDLMPC